MNAPKILIKEYCRWYSIKESFIDQLNEEGLVTIIEEQNEKYILEDELHQLQQLSALHQDLDINLAGLASITHLLHRIKALQEEIVELRQVKQLLAHFLEEDLHP